MQPRKNLPRRFPPYALAVPLSIAAILLHAVVALAQKPESPPTLEIAMPFGVEVSPHGTHVTSITDQAIYRINDSGKPVRIAGSGEIGYAGDGGPALAATMNWPHEVRADSKGNLFIADTRNHAIRRIDAETKVMTTIAGDGTRGDRVGGGTHATAARFNEPHSVVLLDDDTLLVADTKNHRIRQIDLASGLVTNFAGDGDPNLPQPGANRLTTSFFGPRSLAVDETAIWVALREGNSIWRIDRRNGSVTHIAGTGKKGYSGDGGPPKLATMNGPKGLAIDDLGRILVVDTENHSVRRIDPQADRIDTILGGRDSDTKLKRPHGIATIGGGVNNHGAFWIADSENDRLIRGR